MDIDEFFAHKQMSEFQKSIVRFTLENRGMRPIELKRSGKKHVEFYA